MCPTNAADDQLESAEPVERQSTDCDMETVEKLIERARNHRKLLKFILGGADIMPILELAPYIIGNLHNVELKHFVKYAANPKETPSKIKFTLGATLFLEAIEEMELFE